MSSRGWLASTFLLITAIHANADVSREIEFFEQRVRPVLARNCYGCHGPEKQFAALRLDSRESILKGGKSGPAIVPGKPEDSELIKAVHHRTVKMPLNGKLKDSEIAALETWVRTGAAWPKEVPGKSASDLYGKLVKEHWAFQPVHHPELPGVNRASWARSPVDRFVLSALQKRGLSPAAPADKRTLARRLSFVLTGLPPAREEIDTFLRDNSATAYDRLVDRLLASPHFGEHWARYWLDLMRFGETHGYEWNYEIVGAWRYRDYLIRAFNQDVPYDQLIREHIAGDLLAKPRINTSEKVNESVIGTASFRLGEAGHDDCIEFREIGLDVVDNQIDTISKTFQGLTVACARCHDHKLDPIPTEDYYSLFGIVTSARQVTHTIDTPDVNTGLKHRLNALKSDIRREMAKQWLGDSQQITRYLIAAGEGGKNESLDAKKLEHWQAALKREKIEFDDPLYPWLAIQRESQRKGGFSVAWREFADLFRKETEARSAFNRYHFEPFGNFQSGSFDGWYPEGQGLRDGVASSGAFAVAAEGDQIISGVFPAGIYTHLLSEKLNGALRSPFLRKDHKFISLQVMGGKLGARRTIIDNCFLGENYKVLEQDSLSWLKLPALSEQKKLPVYVELVTKSNNPRIPDRPGVLKDVTEQQLQSARSYFGVTRAVLHDIDETPKDELTHLKRLFDESDPRDLNELADRYGKIARQVLTAWSEDRATDDDIRWIDCLIRNHLLSNSKDASPRLRDLIETYRKIEEQLATPKVVDGVADLGNGFDFPVLPYGDWKNPGKLAERGYLKLIHHPKIEIRHGSGRRELAEMIASPENPLTSRVMVNRIWYQMFGRGIVASVDNFGTLGEKPSNPELLDYLATRFMEDGWSVKKMIRFIVLSETFRQSSRIDARSMETDPQNELLHHYPVRRVSAESIRDSILAASGRLDRTMYGPSIQPYREETKDYRRLIKGPLDGNGRRSLYLKVTRMEGAKFLELFDYPNPMAARGSRDITNVPSQALALLNDPFVVQQAGVWADRLLAEHGLSADTRLQEMFLTALSRPPRPDELERFRGLVRELAGLHGPQDDEAASRDVWKDIAHAIFNLKEFIYIQ